jgi:hypothetical protein
VQCLYCETELKPLRGLFDEDFCCKDHREKYFASFRKGITRLPVLDLPPLAPPEETVAETTYSPLSGIGFGSLASTKETAPEVTDVEAAVEEPLELDPAVGTAVEAETTKQAPVVLALEEPAPAPEPETLIEELPAPELAPEPVLAAAEETPEAEPVCAVPANVLEIEPDQVPVLAAAEEQPAVGASIEAAFEDAEHDGAAVTPPAADFLHLDVAPFGAAECYFMIEEDSFPACNGPAIPDVEVFCDAEFDPEERLASLLDPAELVAAGSVSSETGRAAAAEPMAQAPARLTRPSFRVWSDGRPSGPALEVAEIIEDAEIAAAGYAPLEIAKSTAIRPMALPQVPLELLAFHESGGDAAQPQVAAPMQLALLVHEIDSAPLVFSDMAPAPQIHTPVFQVSAVAMQLDEDLKRAIEPPKTEAVWMAEPEIARPAAMSAAPVGRALSSTTFRPSTTPASVRPEAHLNVPAMSSKTDLEPRLASEVVPDIAPGSSGEQPPAADTSQPVQPAIENSARIKNWRLKITFAKPA